MAFDLEGARRAGYSEDEIADFVGNDSGFDVAGARRAGYSSAEIVTHLISDKQTPPAGRRQGQGVGSGVLPCALT